MTLLRLSGCLRGRERECERRRYHCGWYHCSRHSTTVSTHPQIECLATCLLHEARVPVLHLGVAAGRTMAEFMSRTLVGAHLPAGMILSLAARG